MAAAVALRERVRYSLGSEPVSSCRSSCCLLSRGGRRARSCSTCATLLSREGVNAKVVSERLGHASIAITLNTYSHVLLDMQSSAVDAMEAALGTIS